MMDANQVWGVDEAIAAAGVLSQFDPWWIEEPTSPDDVLGHARIRRAIRPIRVAAGEHRPEPRHLQAAVPGGGDRRLPDRRLPRRRRERGPRDHADGREVRHPGVPPRAAVSASASTSSISRSSTTWRSAGSSRAASWSGSTICTSTSSSRRSWTTAGTACRPRPATASRCCRAPWRSTPIPTDRPGRGREALVE